MSSYLCLLLALLFGTLMFQPKSWSEDQFTKLNDPKLSTCDGAKARRKFTFLVSAYLKVPPGTPVDKVSDYVNNLKESYDSTVANWGRYMLSFTFGPCPNNEKSYCFVRPKSLLDGSENLEEGVRVSAPNAIRTGDFSFVLCDGAMCKGLVDPTNKKKIQEGNYTAGRGAVRYTCTSLFVPEVAEPVDVSDLWKGGCPNDNYFSMLKLMTDTGFHSGNMFNIWYFSVPDSDKTAVCEAAGLNEACLDPPTEDALRSYSKNKTLGTNFPFTHNFIERNLRGYSTFDQGIKEFGNKIKSDSSVRLKWTDAFSKDLLMKASIKTTKKVEGDWVMSRIEWDPTLFCKYEKPISDLVTH